MNISVEDRTGQGLVNEELFQRLVHRITKEHDVSTERAARTMDQALAFLATCAKSCEPLSPSEAVDIGWHTFILYTREYADFCERIAGHFIHHEPTDTGRISTNRTAVESISMTMNSIREAGFAVDLPLWTASADCNQCTDGCTHSGGDTGCHHHLIGAATVSA